MELTAQTLREVEFREKLRGYHPDDVDDFLEEAAVALDELLERLRVAETARRGEAASAPATAARPGAEPIDPTPLVRSEPAPVRPDIAPPLAPPPAPAPAQAAQSPAPGATSVTEDTLRRTLVLAQQTADAAIADAHEAAKRIVDEAQAEARRLTETAEGRAAELRAQAQARAAQSMAELEEQRSGLEHEVVALRSWAVQQRDRLRDALTDQVRSLDIWLATSAPSSAAVGPSAKPAPTDGGQTKGAPTDAGRTPDGQIRDGQTRDSQSKDGPAEAGSSAQPGFPAAGAPSVKPGPAPFSAASPGRVTPPPAGGGAPGGAPSASGLVDHEAEPDWVDEDPEPLGGRAERVTPDEEPPPRGFFRGR